MQKILCKTTTCSTPLTSVAGGLIPSQPIALSRRLKTTSPMPTITTPSVSTNGAVYSSILQRNRPRRVTVPFSTSLRCPINCRIHGRGLSSVNAVDGDGEYEKPMRIMSRRNRRSSNGDGYPDLLKIPGVGPRNQRKLVDNGIGDVAELKKLYKDKVLYVSDQ